MKWAVGGKRKLYRKLSQFLSTNHNPKNNQYHHQEEVANAIFLVVSGGEAVDEGVETEALSLVSCAVVWPLAKLQLQNIRLTLQVSFHVWNYMRWFLFMSDFDKYLLSSVATAAFRAASIPLSGSQPAGQGDNQVQFMFVGCKYRQVPGVTKGLFLACK